MPPPAATPPRLGHLLPTIVLAEQLSPSYAKAVNRLPDEVLEEVKSGIKAGRLEPLLIDAVWVALQELRPGLTPEDLMEKTVKAMAKGGGGPRPKPAEERAITAMNTLFAYIDTNVGRASDTARAALETPAGQAMLRKSVSAAGTFMANRILGAAKAKEPAAS